MEDNRFDRFSSAWKKSGEAGSTEKTYTEEDIKLFKMKKSKDFSRALSRSIIFDFVLKVILSVSMIVLVWFYRADLPVVVAMLALIGISVYFIIMESGIKRELEKIDDYTREVSVSISQKIEFYNNHFRKLQFMLAFTSPLLVWVGSLAYFYSKYGYYRIDDLADVLVNLVMVGLAFAISYFSWRYQYKFHMTELEENLAELDDQAMAAIHIQTQKRRKRRFMIGLIILTVLGILLFVYFLATYVLSIA